MLNESTRFLRWPASPQKSIFARKKSHITPAGAEFALTHSLFGAAFFLSEPHSMVNPVCLNIATGDENRQAKSHPTLEEPRV